MNQQWQVSKLVALLKSQTDKLWQVRDKNTELENEVSDLGHEKEALRLSVNTLTAKLENLRKQLQSVQESKRQLEIDLEGKLKDLSSQLSAVEAENERLVNEVAGLQKQVQVEENKKNLQEKLIGMSNQKGGELGKNNKNAKALEIALPNQKRGRGNGRQIQEKKLKKQKD